MLPSNITTTPCVHCSPFAKEKFASDQDFYAFEKVLETKCMDGTFIRIVNSDEIENGSPEATYQCNFCETDWILSFPERSWRGHFLTNEQASDKSINYVFDANSSKRSPNCGCCLGMIFLIIALVLYGLYSLFSFLFDLVFS